RHPDHKGDRRGDQCAHDQRRPAVDVPRDVPVVAEHKAQPGVAERVLGLSDQPDEEVPDQQQDRRGQRGQAPLQGTVRKTSRRRPLDDRATAGDGGGACLHLYDSADHATGDPLHVIVASWALSLAESEDGSGAYGSWLDPAPSVCWPGPTAYVSHRFRPAAVEELAPALHG